MSGFSTAPSTEVSVMAAPCADAVEANVTLLYETYQGLLRAYLMRQLAGRRARADVAEDLTQLTFLRVWKAMQRGVRFHTPAQARHFLFATATNLLRDQWRTDHQRAEVPLPLLPLEEGASWFAEPCAPDDTTAHETWLLVAPVLARLAPTEREALLGYACGYRHHEQAARQGISLAGVKGRIRRARAALRERYDAAMRETADDHRDDASWDMGGNGTAS
jgi:RNA polymerase sigma factor (sigma-70 family)